MSGLLTSRFVWKAWRKECRFLTCLELDVYKEIRKRWHSVTHGRVRVFHLCKIMHNTVWKSASSSDDTSLARRTHTQTRSHTHTNCAKEKKKSNSASVMCNWRHVTVLIAMHKPTHTQTPANRRSRSSRLACLSFLSKILLLLFFHLNLRFN